jgi:hypothetical protein
MFAVDKDGSTEMWEKNTVPEWALWSQQQPISSAAKKDILVWVRMGSECLWKGLFPIRFSQQPCDAWLCLQKLRRNGVATSVTGY